MQFNQMNTMAGNYQQELLSQQMQQQALFGGKQGQLNLAALQQQQLLRSNPLLQNMLNPSLMVQLQLQQHVQMQQLQRIVEAQKIFSKSGNQSGRSRSGTPKTRNQKTRKQNTERRNAHLTRELIDEEKPLPHRRILAVNLPMGYQTIESVTGVFHPYGDVTVVRVLKPGKNLPTDVKPWLRKIPDLGRTCCAIVDFETARAAKFAVHVLRQREDEVGFRCALLKQGIEEKLYEPRKEMMPTTEVNLKHEHGSDSGVTSEDQNSSGSHRSTSASEHSEHSDSDIVSSHAESDAECEKSDNFIKHEREFLLSFAFKNKRVPSGLPKLDHILAKQNVEEVEYCASEPIRQPLGPQSGTNGFHLKRFH